MRIALSSDHGGFFLKQTLVKQLNDNPKWEVVDMGTDGPNSVHYPDYAQSVCQAILSGKADRGVLICGTGLGMSMAANRYPGIRAALCHDEYTARMSRQHNDANVLVLGGRVTGESVATALLDLWLEEPFEGGRHQIRLDKLDSPSS